MNHSSLPSRDMTLFFSFSSSVDVISLSFYTGNNHFVLFFYYCHLCSKTSNCRVLKRFLVSSSWPFSVFNGLTSKSRLPSSLNGAFLGVNLLAQLGSQVYATFQAVFFVLQTKFAQMLFREQSELLTYSSAKC